MINMEIILNFINKFNTTLKQGVQSGAGPLLDIIKSVNLSFNNKVSFFCLASL